MGDQRVEPGRTSARRRLGAMALTAAALVATMPFGARPAAAAPPNYNYFLPTASLPFGYSGTFVELIFGEPGGVNGGELTWFANNQPVESCTRAVTSASSVYGCNLRDLLPGTYTMRAEFSGGGGFDAFSTGDMTPTVRITKADSKITYTGPTSVDAGGPATVSATLKGDEPGSTAAIDGVTLNFVVPGGGQCDAITNVTGTATCTLTAPSAPGTLTMTFIGDDRYNGDTATQELTLNLTPTTTSLSIVPNTTPWGSAVTATATVTPAAATGDVEIRNGATVLATCALTGGVTSGCSIAMPVGAASITAHYLGDAVRLPSASAAVPTFGQARVSTLGFQALPSFQVGVASFVTAVLSSADFGFGVSNADVAFTLGGIPCASPSVTNAAGVAGCFITPQNVTDTDLLATFAGTPRYLASTTGPIAVTVAKATTTTALTSPGGAFGAPITLTATVGRADGGAVNFKLGSTSIVGCAAQPIILGGGGGTATCTTSALPAGSTTVTAEYGGTTNTDPSSDSVAVTVSAAPTVIAYTGATTTAVGGTLAVSASIHSSVTSAPLNGVTLTFTWPGGSCSPITDSSGTAGCTLPSTNAGPKTLTVGFAGVAPQYAADSEAVTITVDRAATTTTVEVPASAVFGELVTLVADVAPGDGTGTVAFAVDGSSIAGCSAATLTAATGGHYRASCTTSSLPAGTHVIVATFADSDDYATSFGTAPLTIEPAPTAVEYTGDESGTVGQPVTLRATLTRQGTAPGPLAGQQITFTGPIGTCSDLTDAAGEATCTITPDHVADGGNVTASFGPTAEYQVASATRLLTIAKAPTVAVLDAPTTAEFGEAVTLTATVAPSVGGGTMSFSHLPEIGTATMIPGCIDLPLTLVGGDWTATCTTTVLTPGRIAVNAHYTGDADYRDTADSKEMLITPAATALEYTGDETGAVAAPLTFAATLTARPEGGTPVPGATVEFVRGDLACTGVTDASGSASCDVTPTSIGQSGPVQVSFAATREYQAATAEGTVELVAAATATALAGPATVGFSFPVELTATVTPAPLGGTVAFADGGTPIAGCAAVPVATGGIARCATTATSVGSHAVTAAFGGTDSYLASTSAPHTLTVVAATTALTYQGPTSAVAGTPVTVSATLTATGPGAPTAGGQGLARSTASFAAAPAFGVAGQTLVFTLGDGSCTATTGADGVATCTLTPATTSAATLVVTFAGAPGFEATSLEVAFAVASAPVPPTTPGPGNPILPATGSNTPSILALALALLAAGLAATRLRRRRA